VKKKHTRKEDHACLQMALELVLNHDPDPNRREQVARMLKQDGWDEAATFAAYHLQCENLREPLGLRPWHPAPSSVDLRYPEDVACPSGQLLLKMLDFRHLQISPGPMAAVASAEQRAPEQATKDVLKSAANITPLRHGAVPPPEDAA
jgi:hypothetical protein